MDPNSRETIHIGTNFVVNPPPIIDPQSYIKFLVLTDFVVDTDKLRFWVKARRFYERLSERNYQSNR
jgi:hypothetical protein